MEHNIYMKTGEFAELVGVLYRRSPDTFLEMFVERENFIADNIEDYVTCIEVLLK